MVSLSLTLKSVVPLYMILCVHTLPVADINDTSVNKPDVEVFKLQNTSSSIDKLANLTQERNASALSDDGSDLRFFANDDKRAQEEWGGNCTMADWDRCKVVKTWFGKYYVKDEEDPTKSKWVDNDLELDCVLEPGLPLY